MGDLAGVPKAECRKRIDYYLKKTSLIEHRKKKMKQLSGGMKRRVGLVQALLNEPEFLIVDEPTTGLDPEERIRIRNLLVDFSENRTVLFSTHVVEDLAATCNQLAIMHKGRFLYAGSMKNLTEEAQGKIWICKVPDERKAREVEQKYRINQIRMSVHGNRKESVDAFLDGRNHEKYHYFCCSSGSSGNIYSFVLSHCCRKSGREKTDRNHEKRGRTE